MAEERGKDEVVRFRNHVFIRFYIMVFGFIAIVVLIGMIALQVIALTHGIFEFIITGYNSGRGFAVIAFGAFLFFDEVYQVYYHAPIEVIVSNKGLILKFKNSPELVILKEKLGLVNVVLLDRGILPIRTLRWAAIWYELEPEQKNFMREYGKFRVSYEIGRAVQRMIDGRPIQTRENLPKNDRLVPLEREVVEKSSVDDTHLIGIALLVFLVLPVVLIFFFFGMFLGDHFEQILVSGLLLLALVAIFYFVRFNIRSRKDVIFSNEGIAIYTTLFERLLGKNARVPYKDIEGLDVLHSRRWVPERTGEEDKLYLALLTVDGERSLGRRSQAEINRVISEMTERRGVVVLDR